MSKRRLGFFVFCFLICSILSKGYIAYSEEPVSQMTPEELYKKIQEVQQERYTKALIFKTDGDFDAAYDILKKLISENPNNNNYQISYIDALLEQIIVMKRADNSEWKVKAKEAKDKIKLLYPANAANADYYLIYAKYSCIVETKRESNIFKALDKAFYFKPNYTYANIVKGDIYSGLAKNSDVLEQPKDSVTLTGGASANTKHMLAMTAKTSYESALSSSDIDDKKKAYVHYKLGELEYQILGNEADAKANWEKAVAISPDSKIGKHSRKRLEQ